MSTDRDEGSVPCQVLVQLVLEADEGLVTFLGELDVAEYSSGHQGSYFERLGRYLNLVLLLVLGRHNFVVWCLHASSEDIEVEGNALEAQHVISIRWYLNLQLGGLGFSVDDWSVLILGVLVEFDAKFEAQIFELFGGEPMFR